MINIMEEIGEAAVLEQLAEECTELAKASLKLARILREENPTPVTRDEARDKKCGGSVLFMAHCTINKCSTSTRFRN